jgi:hypothetical protein
MYSTLTIKILSITQLSIIIKNMTLSIKMLSITTLMITIKNDTQYEDTQH